MLSSSTLEEWQSCHDFYYYYYYSHSIDAWVSLSSFLFTLSLSLMGHFQQQQQRQRLFFRSLRTETPVWVRCRPTTVQSSAPLYVPATISRFIRDWSGSRFQMTFLIFLIPFGFCWVLGWYYSITWVRRPYDDDDENDDDDKQSSIGPLLMEWSISILSHTRSRCDQCRNSIIRTSRRHQRSSRMSGDCRWEWQYPHQQQQWEQQQQRTLFVTCRWYHRHGHCQ